jgi:beta-N-acetylhexosaminidase
VLTAAKHFPGHGSAIGDSHDRPVDISATWRDDELEPYRALIAADPPALIMVGHLTHPRFSDGDRPASLSRRTLTEALRRSLGFDGLIVTDDLGMGAVARRYSVEEAAVMAIRAGADLVLVANRERPDPDVAERIIAAVVAAVAAGRIPASAVADADRRILAARRALVASRAAWGPPSCGATAVTTGIAPTDLSSAAAETGAPSP